MVEGTFRNGSYLVTVHNPIAGDDGDLERALYGSFLPVPDQDKLFPWPPKEGIEAYGDENAPGRVVVVKGEKGKVVLNEGRKRIRLKVTRRVIDRYRWAVIIISLR